MVPMASVFLFLFVIFSLLFICRAQEDRAPHGLSEEHPMAFSPSAYEFFHPKTQQPKTRVEPCEESSNCSPLPLAAETVESSLAHESKSSSVPEKAKDGGIGAGGIAGIIFGFVFAVLLAMCVYYVATARRANLSNNSLVQPNVV